MKHCEKNAGDKSSNIKPLDLSPKQRVTTWVIERQFFGISFEKGLRL